MKNYIGIDLGTTNSAICSYDGKNVHIWKSPEQNDITPSVIYIDRRGNRYYGSAAYAQAAVNPDNSAMLFKRFMGTNEKINIKSAQVTLTPEECSAEILRVLLGYLPEEIRNSEDTGVVITVPAAFNQMKKDATMQAARMAGLDNVALMQEPVAAVMSVMKESRQEGIFLIYDLGGGTFDVSIAENINGKVTLLAHNGIEMCGGRDIDRIMFNKIVVPWLKANFSIPEDFAVNPKYKKFYRIAQSAAEKAKIDLSSRQTTSIMLTEDQARTVDENNNELYLDINITRDALNEIIEQIINDTVAVSRETISKAGLNANDIERIVFVGGPTNYKPLRDRIAFELSLAANTDVNPMVAVAEGASIYAESIDWNSKNHNRKASKDLKNTEINVSFKYTARTPDDTAKVMVILSDEYDGYSIQFKGVDSGWISGAIPVTKNKIIDLPLSQMGDNSFEFKIYNENGIEQKVLNNKLVITKTYATIAAIPASYSIGIEVVDKLGGSPILEFIVNEGDSLPKKGSILLKAAQTLKAGSSDSLNIKLWEGNIQTPITDNRFIGVLKISGFDFETGVIPTGADIECEYEMSDSGNISMSVSIPCIGASFNNKNYYSRQEGQIDLSDIDAVAEQGRETLERIENMSKVVRDPELDKAREEAAAAAYIDNQSICDSEAVQEANNKLLESKQKINKVRQRNLKKIRQIELDNCVKAFDESVRQYAKPVEEQAFDNLHKTAQKNIDNSEHNFDNIIEKMKEKSLFILFEQDWFVIGLFHARVANPGNFIDIRKYNELKRQGDMAIANNDINTLRRIVFELSAIEVNNGSGTGMYDIANILRG